MVKIKTKSASALCVIISIVLFLTYNYLTTNQSQQRNSLELTINVNKDGLMKTLQIQNKTEELAIVDSYRLKPRAQGYVLSGDYWEQLSSASRNLQNFQCWAAKVGAKVLEPYTINSQLRTKLSLSKPKLMFSDLIDLQTWNKESSRMGSAELVSWENFMLEAPRNIIVVEFKYSYTSKVQDMQAAMKQHPEKFLPRDTRYKQGCFKDSEWPRYNHFRDIGFKIIRRVCFNFNYGDKLSLDEFKANIYDTLDPNSTTVYFKQWRGLANFGRINVIDSGCSNTGIQEHMPLSERVVHQAKEYIAKYLSNRDYIAIIARLEKSKIGLKNKPGIVQYCLSKTLEQWRRFSTQMNLTRTFLSIDMGKFGSNSFKQDIGIQQSFGSFFHGVFGDQWNIPEWERSFEDIGGTQDTGYVALLQKIIVTRATCVLFVGGGAFQKHAMVLYQARVPKEERCTHVVSECTKDSNLKLRTHV